ncbi:MAG: 4-(cytidine 5'-diphospho)-2-C-methyl-D-erythritol kinase [Lachnospiraceae bacterium]|nr:4-(cytidine 5'-diphospho)-2-C-methyl-D-erythritol kinase [Lachnospiraceae bacterium]
MNTVSASVSEKAYAKINLALDITGKLPNGYHTLRMVMETVSIHDDLVISLKDDPGMILTCDIEGSGLSKSALSTGSDNLILRAAEKILTVARDRGIINDSDTGLEFKLTKRIPMAAGLAGGSSDAAAALKGLNRLLNLGMSTDELCEIGVTIGADVPYCIHGGSYLAEGIGEILTPLPKMPSAYLILIKPDVDVSTAYVYKRSDENKNPVHPDTDGMISAIHKGDLGGICKRLGNVLRDVTITDLPIISELEDALTGHGALGALMSGSGPTVYGIYDNLAARDSSFEYISSIHPDMYLAKATFVTPLEGE